MTIESSMVGYYARRASEYERIYLKPELQEDLQRLRDCVERACVGAHVLEIACGTGYWTAVAEQGDTYQARKLDDGSTHEVLKNSPSDQDLRAALDGLSVDVRVERLQYYWILTYEPKTRLSGA